MNLVPIKSYKVGQKGLRGMSVNLPKIWVDDQDVKPGDQLYLYRQPNSSVLIISATKLHDINNQAEAEVQ